MTTALPNNIQIIEQDGKPAFAVIPWDDYQALVEGVVLDDSDVWFPNEVVEANFRGDCKRIQL